MSPKFETYVKPPIQEAVLDIFATLPDDVGVDELTVVGKYLEPELPDRKPRYRITGNVTVNVEDSAQNTAGAVASQTGWIFRTPDSSKAVQARVDGFSFNRLPIYDGWNRFIGEAQRHWKTYAQVARPAFITGIGLRYINCIVAPLPVDFRDYCLLFPAMPPTVPATWSEFFMTFNGPASHAKGARVTVSVSFLPPPENKAVLPLILDVTVTQAFAAHPASNEREIWDAFEKLRVEKNLVFEASITDKARSLFRQ